MKEAANATRLSLGEENAYKTPNHASNSARSSGLRRLLQPPNRTVSGVL